MVNNASAWHAASADKSNALLQRLFPQKFSITVATEVEKDSLTAELPWQGCCSRFPVHAQFRHQPTANAFPRQLCRCSPKQPMLIMNDTSKSVQGCQKHSSQPAGEDQTSLRPWISKSKIPQELEFSYASDPQLSVQDFCLSLSKTVRAWTSFEYS